RRTAMTARRNPLQFLTYARTPPPGASGHCGALYQPRTVKVGRRPPARHLAPTSETPTMLPRPAIVPRITRLLLLASMLLALAGTATAAQPATPVPDQLQPVLPEWQDEMA